MGFLVSDVEMNIIMFMYKPEDRDSVGGQRLLRKADFHLGQHINSWFRIRCRLGDQATDVEYPSGAEKRHISMFGNFFCFTVDHLSANANFWFDFQQLLTVL